MEEDLSWGWGWGRGVSWIGGGQGTHLIWWGNSPQLFLRSEENCLVPWSFKTHLWGMRALNSILGWGALTSIDGVEWGEGGTQLLCSYYFGSVYWFKQLEQQAISVYVFTVLNRFTQKCYIYSKQNQKLKFFKYPVLYGLRNITLITSAYAYVILPVVYASSQENLALNKLAWSASNDTLAPPSLAVDGDFTRSTHITIHSSWPFLAVDLGCKFLIGNVSGRLGYREYRAW